MDAQPLGLAVFGAGRIGAVHARNLAHRVPSARLIGVADLDRTASQRLVNEVGVGRVADVQEFLQDPDVRGVVIATPTDTHAQLVELAARAHKNIFCEKPIALSLAATQSAADAAERAGIILQVGFQRRFDREFLQARELVASGKLGSPRFIRLVGRDHRIPSASYLRTSGGQYKDQMVHEFDLARWLLSPLAIEEVYATGSALVDPSIAAFGDVDTALAVLRYSDGALGVIDGSREAVYGYDARGEILGSKGMILIGHRRLRSDELLDARRATSDVESFIERFADSYRDEVIDFVDAIVHERAPQVGAQDALEALRIATAAQQSLHARRPVKLAEVQNGSK